MRLSSTTSSASPSTAKKQPPWLAHAIGARCIGKESGGSLERLRDKSTSDETADSFPGSRSSGAGQRGTLADHALAGTTSLLPSQAKTGHATHKTPSCGHCWDTLTLTDVIFKMSLHSTPMYIFQLTSRRGSAALLGRGPKSPLDS